MTMGKEGEAQLYHQVGRKNDLVCQDKYASTLGIYSRRGFTVRHSLTKFRSLGRSSEDTYTEKLLINSQRSLQAVKTPSA